jgi:hypothetical protein
MPATAARRAIIASPTPARGTAARPPFDPDVERFLADASESLAEALDLELVLWTAVRLPAPIIADIAVLDVRVGRDLARRVVTPHPDPEQDIAQRAFVDAHLPPLGEPRSPLAAVHVTGETLMHTVFGREDAAGGRGDATSTIVVALRDERELLGSIAFIAHGEERPGGPTARLAAEAYARRVSRAIVVARRIEDVRDGRRRAEAQVEVLRHTADVLASCADELRRELDAARRPDPAA